MEGRADTKTYVRTRRTTTFNNNIALPLSENQSPVAGGAVALTGSNIVYFCQ
jgi:hypothetical protein